MGSGFRGAAVVTGAGSGIGRAVALRLVKEGREVAIFGRSADGLKETAALAVAAGGIEPRIYVVDVTDAERVEAAVADVVKVFGEISVLVSNAGVLSVAPVLDLPVEQWRRTIDVNLTGSFICIRAVAREMVKAHTAGRIVTIASVHSLSPGTQVADYDASKGGLLMLTRSLARELAPHGITVNSVGPGLIITNLAGGTSEEYLNYILPTIPLGRAGKASEVAGAVSFLIGPDADYITGAMLIVDGGMLLTADL
jgi:NAD(P)-dependent dehydrogenase (short-subunit alcohol dehydrogenase family)